MLTEYCANKKRIEMSKVYDAMIATAEAYERTAEVCFEAHKMLEPYKEKAIKAVNDAAELAKTVREIADILDGFDKEAGFPNAWKDPSTLNGFLRMANECQRRADRCRSTAAAFAPTSEES